MSPIPKAKMPGRLIKESKERTEEQKSLAEMNLDESYQKLIRGMEHLMGRKLTRQEINMAILQAEQIGDL